MKKLLIVLLIVALTAFLLVGCLPVTPSEGEGEGEGESEVTVVIDGAVVIDGKTYVSDGVHDITVTFSAPVAGVVAADITQCGGDYSKDKGSIVAAPVVLFPDAAKKIWTGSGTFLASSSVCCASYVEVTSGECDPEACIKFPVIIDHDWPYALIEINADNCTCEGCEISFESVKWEWSSECDPELECCGDHCSGLANWSIVLYDGDPFDECCDPSICEEPIESCSGTSCPISCVTDCLKAGTYYAVITLLDAVGNEAIYYAKIVLSGDGTTEDCDINIYEGMSIDPPECIFWFTDTIDMIGECGFP
jgi:hypothetical protein